MRYLLLSIFLFLQLFAKCQIQPPDPNLIANTPAKSGISYEALTQFFQVNLTTNKGGGYDFKATLFGIQKFFSKDSLNASEYYLKKTPARNLEFALGLHKGTEDALSLLQAGIKYALINNRDKSVVNFAAFDNGQLGKDINIVLTARDSALRNYAQEIQGNAELEKELDAADIRFEKSQDFQEYPARVQELYNQLITSQGRDPQDFLQSLQDIYDRTAKMIEKRALLTLSFNPGYDVNSSLFDTTSVSLQYLRGFGNYKKPWNIDLKATHLFQQDTVLKNNKLARQVFIGKVGINKVLVYDAKLNPLVEFEVAYEHDYVTNGLYQGEEHNRPKLVNTLRIHVTKEIFIPLTMKYDLKNANLFGVFRVQWDLQGGKK